MKKLFVTELKDRVGHEVELKGWIHKVRKMKGFAFVLLRDKTGVVQLVVDEGPALDQLTAEVSVCLTGRVQENPKAPMGIEVIVQDLSVLGQAHYDLLPFSINGRDIDATFEKQLDYRYLSLRRPDRRAVFTVQEEIVEAFRSYLRGQRFSEVHTPKIIASETEGGSEVFTVDYFGRRTFLAQSPQFYKQMMVGAGFERVFEIGHAYRAELHSTWRHLNEYVSLDVEMGFIESEEELMDLEEDLLKYIFSHLEATCGPALERLQVTLPKIDSIPRMALAEAQDILLEEYGKPSPKSGIDAEGEKILSKHIQETYGSDFVFLTKYPADKRPAYTMPDADVPGTTKSFDLIFRGLEITTGGQRIHDYHQLVQNFKDFDIDPGSVDFYMESFRYGMPPHGGFAIGLERITMMILGLDNIRQAVLLPRDLNRLTP